MTRPWILRGWRLVVLLIVGVVGGLLLLAQDQETLTIQSPVTANDPRYAEYVASLTGTPVERGDRYEILQNGDKVFPAMLAALRDAKRRISLETYVYEDGVVGDQLTNELIAAAERGVTVRIVLDAVGASLSDERQQHLERAGAKVSWFNKVRPWNIEEVNYRTHRKLVVVDGTVGFTGGIGFADHWLGNAQSEEHWRDTQFRVTGPAVRALEASFYENWLEAGGLEAPALDPERPSEQTGARSLVVWSNPTAGMSRVKLLYLLAIAAARTSIDIQSPYFILDESSRWSLDAARRRGVRVRVLTDGEVTDAKPVKDASRDGYAALLHSGVEIFEYQPTMMHVKAMVVDGVWSIIGSANFDNRSFELNDELSVAIHDPDVAKSLTADFEADLARSTRLDAAAWERRGLWQKTREHFWGYYGELF